MQEHSEPQQAPTAPTVRSGQVIVERIEYDAATGRFAQAQAPGASPAAQQASGAAPTLSPEALASLRARRSELSTQLQSAEGRRNRLAEALKQAEEGPSRVGLEQRIAVLDRRIVQIEADIAETGRQITTSTRVRESTTSSAWAAPIPPEDVAQVASFFTVFVLAPLAVAAARLMWKRGSAPRPRVTAAETANAERLQRIEQAMEAIAIERVSEGQRFVTRLLTDEGAGGAPALGVGQQRPAEPVRVPLGEAVPAGRRTR